MEYGAAMYTSPHEERAISRKEYSDLKSTGTFLGRPLVAFLSFVHVQGSGGLLSFSGASSKLGTKERVFLMQ